MKEYKLDGEILEQVQGFVEKHDSTVLKMRKLKREIEKLSLDLDGNKQELWEYLSIYYPETKNSPWGLDCKRMVIFEKDDDDDPHPLTRMLKDLLD